jgi:hypothetical protein
MALSSASLIGPVIEQQHGFFAACSLTHCMLRIASKLRSGGCDMGCGVTFVLQQ